MKLLLVMLMLVTTAAYAQQKEQYANFPENFESPDTSAKSHYKIADVKLKTGEWTLDQAILGALAGHDRFNPTGKQSIRMQQNRSKPAYLSMNFDVNEGISTVTVAYASYYKDASSIWRLEYSTDGGNTWQQAGKDITAESTDLKTTEFNINVKGKARFRINKLGLGDGKADPSIKNGRLSIDDIAIYKN
jgi:hypothetical protein